MKTYCMRHSRILSIVLAIMCAGSVSNARRSGGFSSDSFIDSLIVRNGITFSEIEETGRVKWTVQGSRAESRDEDVIRIHDVTAAIKQENGEDILIITSMADINSRTREIYTDVYVEIIYGNSVITATGMRVNDNEKNIELLENSQIVFLRAPEDDLTLELL